MVFGRWPYFLIYYDCSHFSLLSFIWFISTTLHRIKWASFIVFFNDVTGLSGVTHAAWRRRGRTASRARDPRSGSGYIRCAHNNAAGQTPRRRRAQLFLNVNITVLSCSITVLQSKNKATFYIYLNFIAYLHNSTNGGHNIIKPSLPVDRR